MTAYKPRSAWTSSGRGGAQLTGSKLVGVAWHWPGTSQDEIGVESAAATANRLRGYRNFHVGTRGWSDIGYNFAIDAAGRVWDLRGLGRVGAHAASSSNPDANHEWMGVLLILGDEERPSARMIRACQDFFYDVFLPRWPRRTRDTGHGRAPGVPGAKTSCPGPFAAELIVDGDLTERPTEDEMPTLDEIADVFDARLNNAIVKHTDKNLAWHLRRILGLVDAPVRWEDGETRSPAHTLSWLQRAVHTVLQAQEGLDTPAILAKLDEIATADAQRDSAILAAVEAIESGDNDGALARLRDVLDAALPDA